MSFADVMILAVIQGITEFLPVSSSGHLLAARLLFGISDADGTSIDAFLHLGTLVAVLSYYWRTWVRVLSSMAQPASTDVASRELAYKLAIATIPGAVIGYLAHDGFSVALRNPTMLAVALVFTALALVAADKKRSAFEKSQPTIPDSVRIGLAQVLALVPGVSRAGITIAAGRILGLSRHDAATFSFLLSAPIIAGAGLSSFGQLLVGATLPASQLLLGFILSLVSGLLAIHLFLKLIERISFTPFAIYLIALASVVYLYGG